MKKNGICAALSFSLLMSAQMAGAEVPGFSGDLILGGVWENGRPSQLDATDADKTISNINQKSDSTSDLDLYLSGELRYTFANEATTLFIYNIRHDGNLLSAGIQHSLGELGSISGAATYGIKEVWKNPYLVGTPRSDTDEVTYGLAFDYTNMFGTGFMLAADIAKVKVDDDLIGKQQKLLQRDGFKGSIGAGYEIMLGEHTKLIPSFTYTRHELDGEANSSNGYGVAMDLVWNRNNLTVEASAGYTKTKYLADHPLYNRERDANELDVSALVSYNEPFGIPHTSVYTFAGYNKVDENINFFDSNQFTAGVGLGYHF